MRTVFPVPSTAKDRQPVKSLVIGRPILLALEDIDGTPSFLEKALRFLEDHGKVSLWNMVIFHFMSTNYSEPPTS